MSDPLIVALALCAWLLVGTLGVCILAALWMHDYSRDVRELRLRLWREDRANEYTAQAWLQELAENRWRRRPWYVKLAGWRLEDLV